MSSDSSSRRRVVRRGSRALGDSSESSEGRSSSRRRNDSSGSSTSRNSSRSGGSRAGGSRRGDSSGDNRPNWTPKRKPNKDAQADTRPGSKQGSKPGSRQGGRREDRRDEQGRIRRDDRHNPRSTERNARNNNRPDAQRLPEVDPGYSMVQRSTKESVEPVAMADTSTTFADLGLPLALVNALKDEGILHPFPIQAKAIPQALDGKDILGRGPTGSGKTFTFGLPIISSLMQGASSLRAPRAVILAPTRELAAQIRARLEPLAGAAGQRVLEVVGGVKISHNIRALARPVDILVATPGRAQDLLDQKQISFKNVEIMALDEADQMADMGFLPQVKRLMDKMPKNAQHLLFSATLDGDVQILVDRYMNNPITHSTGEAQVRVDSMDHYLTPVQDGPARNQLVVDIGKRSTRTIMFTRTKHGADRMAKKLVKSGVRAVALHGNKGQNSRTAAIDSFTAGDTQVMVATDIAARGIDISGVELVVHVDVPAEHKAYVHRAGRTARAGTSGTVVTLCFADATSDALKLLDKAGVTPTELSPTALLKMLQHNQGRA